MQQSCKHDTTAMNRGIIQDGVRYPFGREGIKGRLQTVQVQSSSRQFTTRSPQLRTRRQVTDLCVISCKANNYRSAKENKQSIKQAICELLVTSPSKHVTIFS
jgi:hypothetical protein